MEKKNAKSNVKQEVKLKAGDVVCLKSGGPAMTINNIEKDRATVVWFTCERTEAHASVVNVACLVAVKLK